MSVDVFGRTLKSKANVIRGPPGNGFKLTSTGDFDLEGRKICNLGRSSEPNDAVNHDRLADAFKKAVWSAVDVRRYAEKEISELKNKVDQLQQTVDSQRAKKHEL